VFINFLDLVLISGLKLYSTFLGVFLTGESDVARYLLNASSSKRLENLAISSTLLK